MIEENRTEDDFDSYEEKILFALFQYKALTIEQIMDILQISEANKNKGYYIIRKLKRKGLIRTERVPYMYKKRYAVLSKKGAEFIGEDVKPHEYYVRKEKAGDILESNEVYHILLNQGISDVKARKEVLKELGLSPIESGIKWTFKAANRSYSVYMRQKYKKIFIEKSIRNTPGFDGHIVIYNSDRYLGEDRRKWMRSLPALHVHLTSLDALSSLVTALKDPNARFAEFTEKVSKFVSAGSVVRVKGSPLSLAWQKGKTRMLLCDLTAGDITGPALMRAYSLTRLKDEGWGEGVIYYTEDKRSAKTWARLLENREHNYFITRSEAGLYKIREGKLVQLA